MVPRIFSESDIHETFIRSSGPGGQNVNKVSSAVCLKHAPSGIMVKCGEFRSQGLNRERARDILEFELLRMERALEQQKRSSLARQRRKNRRRSLRAKEIILRSKKYRSLKKNRRRSPVHDKESA
jgi:protein subunit release factor B